MTLLLSMPRRRVDPAVLGVTLAYPSPFYCSVVWNQLVFRSFLVRNTNLPTFTAVCLSPTIRFNHSGGTTNWINGNS